MSRRDTIIVAVLINAGLLIILFATALKTNKDPVEMAAAYPASSSPAVMGTAFQQNSLPSVIDEIQQTSIPQEAMDVKVTPVLPSPATLESSSPAEIVNFAADLNAITLPEASSVNNISSSSVVSLSEEKTNQVTFNEIKVKKGDVLEKIARQHQTTVDEIMKANKLTSTKLKIGQELKIPVKGSTNAKPAAKVSLSQTSGGSPRYYTVKNGDNPWTIAVKNHLKVEELLKLNNLNEEKARRLKPGDQLRIE